MTATKGKEHKDRAEGNGSGNPEYLFPCACWRTYASLEAHIWAARPKVEPGLITISSHIAMYCSSDVRLLSLAREPSPLGRSTGAARGGDGEDR